VSSPVSLLLPLQLSLYYAAYSLPVSAICLVILDFKNTTKLVLCH